MLRTDLIEIINRGNAWAFIGSGCSIDSGTPSWSEMLSLVVNRLDSTIKERILNDTKYQKDLDKQKFPKCFSRIESYAGREIIEKTVVEEIKKINTIGSLTKLLVQFPFKGYITTNYDVLLEKAFQEIKEYDWLPIGNTKEEVRKISGDPSRVIWHIHGSVELPNNKSQLIITEDDYDSMYIEENNPFFTQLRGLLGHARIVFVGFGFEDQEVLRLLKKVGLLSNPARTLYAFMSGSTGAERDEDRKEFLKNYNIDIIPYKVVDGNHKKLVELFKAYSSFILPRSLKFGQPARPCPSYNPETTGLLIYNELCLRSGTIVSADILGTLLRARILSLLKHKGPSRLSDLIEDLDSRIRALNRTPLENETINTTKEAIAELLKLRYIYIDTTNGSQTLGLTNNGETMVEERAATSERLAEQFSVSLLSRASQIFLSNQEAALRVAKAAESFLKECVERRALGVAMILYAPEKEFQSYHMVALMQALPDFMGQLSTTEEAIALSNLVQGILSKPSEAEKQYIGLSLQAKFGVHLLGYDLDTLTIRAKELEGTLFLVDSTTLIPFLAKSSVGYNSANLLINRLKTMGSFVATTFLLSQEVAEHARYAAKKVEESGSRPSVETLKALTGRAGERSNAFLEGFIEEIQRGGSNDFSHYIGQVCDIPSGTIFCTDEDICRAIQNREIYCYDFDEWEGFLQEMWNERDQTQEKIALLRAERKTFKHERQVKAEAEALIITQNFRKKIFFTKNRSVSNAYFVSHTRVIDAVAGRSYTVTMRPGAVLQWIATINPCTLQELQLLTTSLLTELSEKNFDIIDKSKLYNAFSPLISASEDKLTEEIARNRVLISDMYGESSVLAFQEINKLDTPIALECYNAQKADWLAKELEKERKLKENLKKVTRLDEKEKMELTKLRTEKKMKRRKAVAKKKMHMSHKKKHK